MSRDASSDRPDGQQVPTDQASPEQGPPGQAGGQPVRRFLSGQFLSDEPSGRRMPTDFSISVRPGHGALADREPSPERRQSMRGFEDGFSDIVDYIVRITHRIWEDQDAGYIYDTYAPGCVVYDDSGAHFGVERVVQGTIGSIHAFPDIRSYADDVIWAGDDEQGFATSHRYINTGHHQGAWQYGPATGRTLNMWGIANCVVIDNEIVEEWVLYNMASKLRQLGIDVVEAARAHGNALAEGVAPARHVPEVWRLDGGRKPLPFQPDPSRPWIDQFVRGLWHDVFNRRDLSAIRRAYSPTVHWNGTSDRVGHGAGDVLAFSRALLATFPDLGVLVEEVYWMGNDEDGYRVSLRWSGAGTHRGHALYGEPSGRRVHLWGISQLYVSGGRITTEWSLFNEFDVLAQIMADQPLELDLRGRR
ncbi:ester cyclase [Luteococcus peritonei]|uniref:Ester cyclase n=1 Tax=Luteococcus peritonei TaxID=88874 RepID=A0ABW4RS30_9ACTN